METKMKQKEEAQAKLLADKKKREQQVLADKRYREEVEAASRRHKVEEATKLKGGYLDADGYKMAQARENQTKLQDKQRSTAALRAQVDQSKHLHLE